MRIIKDVIFKMIIPAAAAASFLLIALSGCGSDQEESSADAGTKVNNHVPIVTVDVASVVNERVDTAIETVGSLEPAEDVEVSIDTSGIVKEILFQEGAIVEKDQLLALLDDEKVRLDHELAEKKVLRLKDTKKKVEAGLRIKTAGLKRIEAEVRQAKALRDNAKSKFDRKKSLFDQGAATEAIFLDAKTESESAQAALDRAAAALEEAHGAVKEIEAAIKEAEGMVNEAVAGLSITQERIDDMSIRAPFSGILSERTVGPGDFVDKGESIVSLVAINPLKAVFSVPERYRILLKTDQKVSLKIEAVKDRIFSGKVVFISPNLDTETRSVRVKAVMENSDGLLKPGFFCHVKIILHTNPEAVVIPEEAVSPRGESFFVYTVENNKAVLKQIELGLRMTGRVEVKKGLKEGEQVIVAGLQRVTDTGPVRIRKKEKDVLQKISTDSKE